MGTLDEEDADITRNLWRQFRVLPPTSLGQRRWASLLRILYLVNLFTLPIDLCFYHLRDFRNVVDWMDLAIDIIFMLDVLANSRTTYRVDDTNELVTDWRIIGSRYLTGWAIPDVPAALPWALTGVRELKLLKLLRGFHIGYRNSLTVESGKSVNTKRVGSVLTNFFILSHWVACLWWLIGAYETDLGLFSNADVDRDGAISPYEWSQTVALLLNVGDSKAERVFGDADFDGDKHLDYDEFTSGIEVSYETLMPFVVGYDESWLQRIPKIGWNGPNALVLHKASSTFAQQYFSALYWALTALVKVPWIAPNTVLEKFYSSLVVMLGAIFFASLLGAIVAAINAIERSNAQRRDKMTLMHNFVATRRLTSDLKQGMTRYVDAMFAFNNEVEGIDRLGTLPGRLRGALLEVIYKSLLESCDLLKTASRPTALKICGYLTPQVCLAKSLLVEKNAVPTHLFFLHRGAMQITLGEDLKARKSSVSGKGPHLKGKVGLRVRPVERMGQFVGCYDPYEMTRLPIEVMAVKLSQLFAIERHALVDVLEAVGMGEANAVVEALNKELEIVLGALKFNRTASLARTKTERLQLQRSNTQKLNAAAAATATSAAAAAAASPDSSPMAAGGRASQSDQRSQGDVRFSCSDSPGPDGEVKRKPPRRKSVGIVQVGSLLNSTGSGSIGVGNAQATAAAVVSIWDDAVDAVKVSTRELEETSNQYKREVHGFVKGLSAMEQLIAAIQIIPEAERPHVPLPPLNTAAVAKAASDHAAGMPSSALSKAPSGVDSMEPPTSGARLLNNIAQMGQQLFGGSSKPPSPTEPESASARPAPAGKLNLLTDEKDADIAQSTGGNLTA